MPTHNSDIYVKSKIDVTILVIEGFRIEGLVSR